MRHTPFLDQHGYTLKDTVPDSAAQIIDAALAAVSAMIDWGSYEGKQRNPCREQPLLLAGAPLGQYHCPDCGMMLLAGMPHLPPGAREPTCTCPVGSLDPGGVHTDYCATNYPDGDYEDEYGRPWPPGYVGAD